MFELSSFSWPMRRSSDLREFPRRMASDLFFSITSQSTKPLHARRALGSSLTHRINDPADIPKLLQKIAEGYDVASGWRKKREDPFWSRRFPSILANSIISSVTGVHLHDFGCTLKAYRRSSLEKIRLYGEMHRFLPAWCAWRGAKITEVEVHHLPRTKGRSKYGLGRTFKVVLDLLTTKFISGYLTKPSYFFGGLGLLFYLTGALSGGVAFYDKLGPDRWPALRIPLLLLAGFLGVVGTFLLLMGLIAELIVRLYYEISREKPYQIKRTLSLPGEPD